MIFNDYLKEEKAIFTDESRTRLTEEITAEINNYIINYLIILKNLALNLKLANEKIKFRHNDLDYRNFTVDEENNVYIYDFGSSKVDVEDNYACMDFRSAFKSSLDDGYLKSKTVLEAEYTVLSDDQKNTIKNNGRVIFNKIKENGIISRLETMANSCNRFMGTFVSFDEIIKVLN